MLSPLKPKKGSLQSLRLPKEFWDVQGAPSGACGLLITGSLAGLEGLTEHSFLILQRVGARLSGNPKGKAREPWSWSPTREPRALAELDMS